MNFNKSFVGQQVTINEGDTLIVRTDLKGRITDVNSLFTEVTGYSRDELIGSNSNITRHPDIPAAHFERLWSSLKQGHPWQGIMKNRTKDGRFFWVHSQILPASDEFEVKEYIALSQTCSPEQVHQAEQYFDQLQVNPLYTPSIGWWDGLKSKLQHSINFASSVAQITSVLIAAWLFFELVDSGNPTEFVMASILTLMLLIAITYQSHLITQVFVEAQGVLKKCEQKQSFVITDLERNGTASGFFRQLAITQGCLQAEVVQSQQQNVELTAVNKAFENIDSAVMLLDENLNISFVNPSAKHLFESIEQDIQSQSSEFSTKKIIGSSIGIFFNHIEEDSQFWQRLQQPLSGQIQFGDSHLTYVASPVSATEQDEKFILIEWSDRTDTQIVEQAIESVINALIAGDLSQRVSNVHHLSQYFWVAQLINELGDAFEQTMLELKNHFKSFSAFETNQILEQDQQGPINTLELAIKQHFSQLSEFVHELSGFNDQLMGSADSAKEYDHQLLEWKERQAINHQYFKDVTQSLATSLNDSQLTEQLEVVSKAKSSHLEQANVFSRKLISFLTELDQHQNGFSNAMNSIDEIIFKVNLAITAAIGETGVSASVAYDMRTLTQQSALELRKFKVQLEESNKLYQQTKHQVKKIQEVLSGIEQIDKKVTQTARQLRLDNVDQKSRVETINQAAHQISDNLMQHEEIYQDAVSSSLFLHEQTSFINNLLARYKSVLTSSSLDLKQVATVIDPTTPDKHKNDQPNHFTNRETKSGWGSLAQNNSNEWEEF